MPKPPKRSFLFLMIGCWMMGLGLIGCSHGPARNNPPDDMITIAINFYRGPLHHLDAVRAGACPMLPGCSDYSRQAIRKHGPVIGWIMACDRLLRCGRDELSHAPSVLTQGERKYFDPLANNDWWWNDPHTFNPLATSPKWQISWD